jgi:hypothetical protein
MSKLPDVRLLVDPFPRFPGDALVTEKWATAVVDAAVYAAGPKSKKLVLDAACIIGKAGVNAVGVPLIPTDTVMALIPEQLLVQVACVCSLIRTQARIVLAASAEPKVMSCTVAAAFKELAGIVVFTHVKPADVTVTQLLEPLDSPEETWPPVQAVG